MSNHNDAGSKQNYLPSRIAQPGSSVDSLESQVRVNPSTDVDRARTLKQGGRVDLRVNEANLEDQIKLNKSVQ